MQCAGGGCNPKVPSGPGGGGLGPIYCSGGVCGVPTIEPSYAACQTQAEQQQDYEEQLRRHRKEQEKRRRLAERRLNPPPPSNTPAKNQMKQTLCGNSGACLAARNGVWGCAMNAAVNQAQGLAIGAAGGVAGGTLTILAEKEIITAITPFAPAAVAVGGGIMVVGGLALTGYETSACIGDQNAAYCACLAWKNANCKGDPSPEFDIFGKCGPLPPANWRPRTGSDPFIAYY